MVGAYFFQFGSTLGLGTECIFIHFFFGGKNSVLRYQREG